MIPMASPQLLFLFGGRQSQSKLNCLLNESMLM